MKNGRYHHYRWQISDLEGLKSKKCPILEIYFAWLQCWISPETKPTSCSIRFWMCQHMLFAMIFTGKTFLQKSQTKGFSPVCWSLIQFQISSFQAVFPLQQRFLSFYDQKLLADSTLISNVNFHFLKNHFSVLDRFHSDQTFNLFESDATISVRPWRPPHVVLFNTGVGHGWSVQLELTLVWNRDPLCKAHIHVQLKDKPKVLTSFNHFSRNKETASKKVAPISTTETGGSNNRFRVTPDRLFYRSRSQLHFR